MDNEELLDWIGKASPGPRLGEMTMTYSAFLKKKAAIQREFEEAIFATLESMGPEKIKGITWFSAKAEVPAEELAREFEPSAESIRNWVKQAKRNNEAREAIMDNEELLDWIGKASPVRTHYQGCSDHHLLCACYEKIIDQSSRITQLEVENSRLKYSLTAYRAAFQGKLETLQSLRPVVEQAQQVAARLDDLLGDDRRA